MSPSRASTAGRSTTWGRQSARCSPGRLPVARSGRSSLRHARSYAVGPQGHLLHGLRTPPGAPASQRVLRYWDAATGQDRAIATIEGAWVAGLSASPDGRTVLWGRSTLASDLMMIENFR